MYMVFKPLIIGGEIVEEEGVVMEIAQQTAAAVMKGITNVAYAKCECCGLTEECTEEYIKRVRDRYWGRWICGLCGEAVKDEIVRSENRIGNEEALNQHMSFCNKLRRPPKNPTEELICAVKQLVLRSLDSPRSMRTPRLLPSQTSRPAPQN